MPYVAPYLALLAAPALASRTGLFLAALPPGITSFLYIPLIIVVFYFLMIRPQQSKQKQWQADAG